MAPMIDAEVSELTRFGSDKEVVSYVGLEITNKWRGEYQLRRIVRRVARCEDFCRYVRYMLLMRG